MKLVITLLMLGLMVLAVLMIFKRNRGGAAVCAGLVVLLAIGRIFSTFWGPTPGEVHLLKARQVMVDGMARKVAERWPGGKVLLLDSSDSVAETAIAKGNRDADIRLLKALTMHGLDVESIASPSFQWDDGYDSSEGLPLLDDVDPVEVEMMAKAEAEQNVTMMMADTELLNELLLQWKGRVDAVVLTLPLDPDMLPNDLPVKGEAPPLVLMSAPLWTGLEEILEVTALDLVLLYKAQVSQYVTRPWPKDDTEAFDQRFFFVTAEKKSPESE